VTEELADTNTAQKLTFSGCLLWQHTTVWCCINILCFLTYKQTRKQSLTLAYKTIPHSHYKHDVLIIIIIIFTIAYSAWAVASLCVHAWWPCAKDQLENRQRPDRFAPAVVAWVWSSLRFHEWWNDQPSGTSILQHRAWFAGTASQRWAV